MNSNSTSNQNSELYENTWGMWIGLHFKKLLFLFHSFIPSIYFFMVSTLGGYCANKLFSNYIKAFLKKHTLNK
jgi:hypothetical protein